MVRTLRSGLETQTDAPRDDAELRDWLATNLGVRLPDRACCPEHTAPFQAFADAYFARAELTVWLASRGFGGKSFMLAALALTEAATLGAEVRVLGGSARQSENVIEYMDDWTSRPAVARQLAGREHGPKAGITVSRVRFGSGGKVVALAASTKDARGPHGPRLRVDEADELAIRVFNAALGQPMTKRGVVPQIVVSSTWQYPDGTMTEVIERAKDSGWPVARWCYRCTERTAANPSGWLDPAQVEKKRGYVPVAMWAAEYDLQEPAPESRAFMPSSVEAMFDPELGIFRGAAGEYIEIEAPVDGARYSTGADWAKERDWTVIFTLRYDVRPARLVAYERIGRKPWPMMVARFDNRVRRFPGRAYYDATGLGNVVADLLEVNATPKVLAGRSRADMLNQYIVAVEGGGADEVEDGAEDGAAETPEARKQQIVAPRIEHAYGEHKYASNDDLFGDGHLPDSICAGALAWIGAAPKKTMTGRLTG